MLPRIPWSLSSFVSHCSTKCFIIWLLRWIPFQIISVTRSYNFDRLNIHKYTRQVMFVFGDHISLLGRTVSSWKLCLWMLKCFFRTGIFYTFSIPSESYISISPKVIVSNSHEAIRCGLFLCWKRNFPRLSAEFHLAPNVYRINNFLEMLR